MEVLVLDGKNYVKASKAARELGYATDYVGQLCRNGQVDAHLIGRTWYVNQEELGTHRVEKKRNSRVKAREYAKKTIEEYRKQNEKTNDSVVIHYENDTEPLIPEARKICVVSERVKGEFVSNREKLPKMVIENKGEKIKMSGNLNVIDVTDGEIDGETTVLTSKIFPSRQEEKPTQKDDLPHEISQEAPFLAEPARISFVDKLEAQNIAILPQSPENALEEEMSEPFQMKSVASPRLEKRADISTFSESRDSMLGYIVFLCLLSFFLIASLGISHVRLYTFQGSEINVVSSYSIQISKVLLK